MQTYGYGWFWTPIDTDRAMLVPPSTAYPTPPLHWWHQEGCAVDSDKACDCATGRKADA